MACPTSARLFGDVHDPESVVSKAIRERGGYALMPEWETKPANMYLPRRKTEVQRMKPAWSVILLTTLIGAAQGLFLVVFAGCLQRLHRRIHSLPCEDFSVAARRRAPGRLFLSSRPP